MNRNKLHGVLNQILENGVGRNHKSQAKKKAKEEAKVAIVQL